MPITFVHLAGSKKGRTEVFGTDRVRIGRDPSNDLRFDPYQDRDASSRHAEVTREGPEFWISDLGSTNGTFLNGERITRHSLKDGDVIAFGRGGPKLRFAPDGAIAGDGAPAPAAAGPDDETDPGPAEAVAGAAAAAGAPMRREQRPADRDAARPDIPAPKLPGPQTMKMILQRAARKAKSGQGSSIFGGTATFVKEVIRQAREEATATVKLMLYAAGAAFVLLFAVVLWLGWELYSKTGKLEDTEAKLQEMREVLERDFQDRLRQSQKTYERLEQELREKVAARERELEERITDFETRGEAGAEEATRLRKELEKLRTPNRVFQEIARRVEPAVYLVYTRYEVRRKPDAPADLPPAPPYYQGFGTGFCVTPQGHIVTNKHVVKPWLFSKAKAGLDHNHLEVRRDPTTGKERVYYAVWPSTTRVMETRGSNHLSFTGGFNNIVHANLELFATGADEMRTFQTAAELDGKQQVVQVYAHDPSSLNDVAVLKATGLPGEEFPYMNMVDEAEIERLRKGGMLDPVLVMGFPRGTRVLEDGIANPSPTTGFIRKVEQTIHVDASISPGNSGGPVIDLEGRVLGIATRIADAGAETHGFAIPITKAREILPADLLKPK